VNKSYGFSRYIKSKNQKCYIEVHFIHQRRHPDGCLHGRSGRQNWRLRFPSPWGEDPGGARGGIGSTDESRRRGAEASQIREVVLLDLLWSDGSFPWRGDGVNNPLPFSRIGSGGNWRPPIAPGCRGSRGAPDGRGRRGAPRRASALSSPGKQRKGGRKRKSEDEKRSP
jgi:hypothetical protein